MNATSKDSTAMKALAAILGAGALTAVAIVLAIALWPEDSAAAKSNFCGSLNNLSATVANYEGLNPATATSEQLDAAGEDITNAWNDVANDANDWANAYDNPLAGAYDDLYWAIQDLPDGNTVAQDIEQLQPELSAFPSAFHETFDGSGCSTV